MLFRSENIKKSSIQTLDLCLDDLILGAEMLIKEVEMENQTVDENKKETAEEIVEETIDTKEEASADEATEEEKVVELEGKKEEDNFKEKFLYLAAEMENMKRRFEREKEGLLKYGTEKILNDLIDVVDNLERTVQAIKQDDDEKIQNIVVGIDMVSKQFIETLSKHGLEQVESEGKEFDPNFHEAMSQMEVEGKSDNEIVQVFQQGYTLNGRLIRAAKVIVAK